MPLKGKTVYMTGGTGGIGAPLAERLRQAGATVTLYDRSKDGDLADTIERVCQKLAANTPDILINMAGINDFDYAENQNYESLVRLNLLVPMRLCQAVLPAMKERNSGHIVTVGSMAALIPLPHVTGYSAAKAGLKAFTDALRRELGGTNIAVTHIAPRAVWTSMNAGPQTELNRRTGVHQDHPDAVADLILKAIVKRKREVRIGWPERLFAFLNANIPPLIDKGLQKSRKAGEDILNAE